MEKFSEMNYERPDFDLLYTEAKVLLEKMERTESPEAFFEAVETLDSRSRRLMTQAQLCYIRFTLDTRDPFYAAEQDVFDAELPRFEEINADKARIMIESRYRDQIITRYGDHLLEKYEVLRKAFSPNIVEDMVEENKLSSEYEKLMASALVDFEGEKRNLSAMKPFMESPDRAMRCRASDVHWQWIAGHAEQLDDLYDKLVRTRHRIGRRLGYDNFIPVAYARMGRTDWTQQDAAGYRDQIAEHIVPLAQRLYVEQSQRIRVEDMKYYDYNLEFQTGNPLPRGGEDRLVEIAQAMYRGLSPQTGAFFDEMIVRGLMDLSTREGKAGGGYMTWLADYKVPFIFSNFNGTSDDVDVLTHEAGHAFQGYVQRDAKLLDLTSATAEVAEVHSMSMEFFTHPWMSDFFGEDSEKYRYSHVVSALKFLPYGASIDEFQEWVYEHPKASPAQRHARYREIEKKYLPHLDYDGLGFLEKGGRWQKQAHVYLHPFYYLDYTLASVCAFEYFFWDKKDHAAAWASYVELCRQSGLMPFRKLTRAAGLHDPFTPGAIARMAPKLSGYLDSLDRSAI